MLDKTEDTAIFFYYKGEKDHLSQMLAVKGPKVISSLYF